MARGGKRVGTPGAAYRNRTDLMQSYAGPASGTPQQAQAMPSPGPAPSAPAGGGAAAAPGFPAVDDTPFLDAPDDSPNVLPGFGGGVEPPGASRDLTIIKKYLPDMRQQAAYEDAPPTFKAFVRWLEVQ